MCNNTRVLTDCTPNLPHPSLGITVLTASVNAVMNRPLGGTAREVVAAVNRRAPSLGFSRKNATRSHSGTLSASEMPNLSMDLPRFTDRPRLPPWTRRFAGQLDGAI